MEHIENVYNTTDPEKLLELKRLEADTLLDVLRTINIDDLKIEQLCTITRNVLRAQLGVKKMLFLYEYESTWIEGIRLGFPLFPETAIDEVMEVQKVSPVSDESCPSLQALQAEYVLPIRTRDGVAAYFVIADFADSEIEAQNDLIFIETLGNILSVAIRNKQLFKEKMEQEFLKKELEVAETIQKQLLISDFSRFREMDVYGVNIAHHGVGGDFYDVIKKGKGNTFVCIADVSGKGIGAALLMSNLQANLRALCAQYSDLKDIIRELNTILFNITTGEKFVTLFLAKIDSQNQLLTYVNAGHNYPIFLQGSKASRLDKGCMLLGIMPELDIQEQEISFGKEDLLFMFTDGVVEQTNPAEEMYGSERIMSELLTHRALSSQALTEYFLQTLENYSGGIDAQDDVTMLCVKFL
ncbi:MAG: PP2C family protein-serine/threonine phosphatase [Bacteroidota bacterium]